MTKGKAPVPQIEQDNPTQSNKQSQVPASEPKIRVDTTADTTDAAEADGQRPTEGDFKSNFVALFVGHEHAILGGIVGLAIAFLMFTIGFWKTLFITVLVVIGVAIGQLIDGDPKIINVLRRFIDAARSDD